MSQEPPTGNEPRPLQIGDMLGQYQLVELIAVGGMGLVYRAYDPSLDRFVAIKVLAPELARDPEIARRFLNEARAAAALNHPNVVHVYTAGDQAGTVYFAMELVSGQHLEELLNQHGPLTSREAAAFIRQTILGLQHAHEHGLIHGDVKPANFLVKPNEQVKVTDFGLVRRVKASPTTADESLFGTPGYLSPEVITGQTPDHRSDIYSLGATLFHMLAGQPPFVGNTPEQTLRLHVQAAVPDLRQINPQIPAALVQIVLRMLAKDPAARYQSYAELLKALDQYLAERHLTGPRPLLNDGAAQKPPTPAPKRKSPVGTILVLFFIAACAVILYFVYQQKNANLVRSLPVIATNSPAVVVTNHPTPTQPDPAVERERQHEIARQQWQSTQTEIETLRTAGNFSDALELCNRIASGCIGFADLTDQIDGVRQAMAHALQKQQAEAKVAAAAAAETARQAAAAATQARQEKLRDFNTELSKLVTSLQWEQGRQAVLAARAELGAEPVWSRWDSIITGLLALRTGISERLKTTPSATVTLTTKHGEVSGQVASFDATHVNLRQSVGDAGFAEVALTWSEITPASVCRLYRACLDVNQVDELFGYAMLIGEQALAQRVREEDARKTLQAVVERDPAHAAIERQYLEQLNELDRQLQEIIANEKLHAEAAVQQQHETDAQNGWAQLQTDIAQKDWTKAGAALVRLTNTFASTDFVKTHADNILQIIKTITRGIILSKGYAPLDIGSGCNATFLMHGGRMKTSNGFRSRAGFGGLPDDGVVQLSGADPGGILQLRTDNTSDAIGLSASDGRFQSSATVSLPVEQQKKYQQLVLLTSSSRGEAILSVVLTFQGGETMEKHFHVFDWTDSSPPKAQVGLTATRSGADSARYMYLDFIDADAHRALTGLTFKWQSDTNAGTNDCCAGIFAVSGLPAK